MGNNTRRSATDATSPGVTAGASNKDGSHEVKLTPGWLARDIAIASARLQPQVSVSEGEDAELCGRLEHLHNMLPAAVGWTVEERDAPKEAAARIRSLSSRVEEAGRARREEELREDARLGAALARAEAAETRSAELARALNELIIAADSLATTANLSQADREIDRALSALAGHDAAIRAGGDDA